MTSQIARSLAGKTGDIHTEGLTTIGGVLLGGLTVYSHAIAALLVDSCAEQKGLRRLTA